MPTLPGHGGPADDRRQRAGGAADDDVLRRRALEQHRVDDDVEADRQQGQERREQVDEPGHDHERDDAEHDPEDDRPLGLDLVGRQRPASGPGHQQVDVAIEVAVDGVGAAGRQRAADHRPEDERAPVGPVHAAAAPGRSRVARTIAGHGRDEQQLDDPRLGQRDVGADRVAGRSRAPDRASAGSASRPESTRRADARAE